MKLSQLSVKNAKPKIRAYKLTDGAGMYLLVSPGGSKYWRLKYRYAGRERLLALGVYPAVSLQEARQKRDVAKAMLRDGRDPAGGETDSFDKLVNEWLRINRNKWTPEYAVTIRRRIEKYLTPCMPSDLAQVTPKIVLNAVRKVEKKGKTETAHKVLGHAVGIFQLAVIEGLIKYNPARELSAALIPHKVTPMRTITLKELPSFLKAANASKTNEVIKLATLITMHTFLRSRELRGGRWDEIDWKKGIWEIPAERMKMKESHLVPLSRQVIAYLKRLKMINGDKEHIFAALSASNRQKHPIISENAVNNFIGDIGFGEKLVGHGFRALASTALNEELEFPPDVIERQLAHKEGNRVRAAYNRAQYLSQRIEMMQAWSDYIDSLA